MTTWDLLIPTIPHRHASLCALLEHLDGQWQPGFGVRVMRDNLQRRGIASYAKWQDLADSSEADYISYAGDDDWVDDNFVPRIMEALEAGPDYVGFQVKFTLDGHPQPHVQHSLRYGGWADGTPFTRDVNHSNPMRRELSTLARWGSWGLPDEDAVWAQAIRSTGKVKAEEWIAEPPMYHYQRVTSRNFWATTQMAPWPEDDIKPLPEYPWLTAYDSC